MKAEERHQLKDNDLASWMQYGLPMFLKNNGSYLLLAAALCFLGYQLYGMYERKQENARMTAFDELRTAPNSENPVGKLQNLIDTTEFATLKAQAYLALGQAYQEQILFPEKNKNQTPRSELLEKAGAAYSNALERYKDDVLGAGKALLGKAAVLEDQEKWDEAGKVYETMADGKGRFAGTPFVALAEERLKTMPDRKLSPRLATMMPAPTAAPASLGGLPGLQGLPGGFAAPTLPEGGGGAGPFATPPGMAAPEAPATQQAPATQAK